MDITTNSSLESVPFSCGFVVSLFFNEFFHMVFFRNESPVFHLDMFGFHLKLESRRLGDIKTE